MQPALNNNTRGESPENLQAAATVRSQNQTYSHAKEQEVIAVGSKRLAEKSEDLLVPSAATEEAE